MDAARYSSIAQQITDEIGTVIVGQTSLVRDALLCLLAEGHLLIEGVPGLGKTQLVTALAAVVGADWRRIQFTPDLMPADIVGTQVLVTDDSGGRSFRFQAGPVFTNLVLADEINRATPKTQSALLEAMQERHVTSSGETRPLPRPFLVLATQNPIEQEGTYPLPEAQLDRFLLKSVVERPSVDELTVIIDRTTSSTVVAPSQVTNAAELRELVAFTRAVPVPSHVVRYVAELVEATHPHDAAPDIVRRYARFGASPRGAQALILGAKATALLDGRPSVAAADVAAVAPPALPHRVGLGFEAAGGGVVARDVVGAVLDHVSAAPSV